MTDDSMERIVSERLDRIFGDDDEDEEVRKPAADTPKSDIDPVKQAVVELESSVQPGSINRLTSSIQSLQRYRGKDPLFLPLLKMMYILAGHLKPGRPDVNQGVLKSLRSNIECMEALETGQTLPESEKRKRVQKEIESFKEFREAIKAPSPPEKAPEDAAPPFQAKRGHTGADTPAKSDETASPTPEPSSAGPEAEADPPQPEPKSLKAPAPASIIGTRELDAFREDLSDLKAQLQGIVKTLEVQSAFGTKLRDAVSQIEKQVNALSPMPGAIRTLLKKAMEKPSSRTEEPAVTPIKVEDVRSSVTEVMEEGLKAGLKDLSEMPSALLEVKKTVSDAFARLENKIDDLNEEIRSTREGLQSIRSDVDSLRIQGTAKEAAEEESFQPVETEFEPPAEEYEPPGPAGEPEDHGDMEKEPDGTPGNEISPSRPGLPTGGYFLFAAGGKKYAVDERYVVKTSEAGTGLLKKARVRGGLTISDSSSGLFNKKKGIEPAWSSITPGEVKQTIFRLVSEGVLDGLENTEGEGVLFLGAGDERILLFTDHPAVKITLGQGDEVQMSGSSSSRPGPVCGSIQRSGEQNEFYLIISPEKLG